MRKTIDISQVPKDFDESEVLGVRNPLEEDFTHKFGGIDFIVPAKSQVLYPSPVANHLAKHLAQRICQTELYGFLKQEFEGFTETGLEKWRVEDKYKLTKEDIFEVKKVLLFSPNKGEKASEVVPEGKMGKLKKQAKKAREAKEEAKAEARADAKTELKKPEAK